MTTDMDKVKKAPEMSRRAFVASAASAVAVMGVAGGLTACQPADVQEEPVGGDIVDEIRDITTGEWIPAACWHNCGGRCVNKVLVQDGVVIRQKTDDSHDDSIDYPQQRACVRGRSQRNQVFSADRLKYPMKRKSWQPGGGENSHGELRGKDEWERISWDEAFTYIADEMKRIKEAHGNRSFLAMGGEVSNVLSLYGGFIPIWGTTSQGSWHLTPDCVGIYEGDPDVGVNDRYDIQKAEIVVMIGLNPAWSSAGNPSNYLFHVKKAGAKFVAIDPFYNDSYNLVDAEWIPCRPSTDTALLLGVANAMLELDEEKSLIDWDYLNRCTIGFDAERMPEGEDPKGNFKDYLLGTYDGVPKTPEWASKICGVDPAQIRYLAELVGKDNKTAILLSWSSGRTHNSDNLPQLVMTIGAMGGHFGKSGHMCGISCYQHAFNGGPSLISEGDDGYPGASNPLGGTEGINHTEMWHGILEGKYTYGGTRKKKVPGEERELDIKLIYHDKSARLQTADGQAEGIEAHRKVDLVVSHGMFLTTNAKYSDIVLPVVSEWETEGGFLEGNREAIFYHSKVIERMYECKSDREIAAGICEKLGLDPAELYPFDDHQALFNRILGATIVDQTGETVPLVTITADDIAEWGCEGAPQEGVIALSDLIKNGVYQIARQEGDGYGYIAYEDFVADPEANPMGTESGKQEIYSRLLRDQVNMVGYSKIEAIPTYIPPQEGVEATYSDFEAGTKGDYPYQLYNPHYLRRSHTVFDNVQWLRETWPNPVFLNASDAAAKGIALGDTVLVESPHGKCLRKASPTERIMPGVVALPHGSWVDVDEATGIDRAGSDNYLTGQIQSGQGVSGWNTCICNFEKYTEEIPNDIDVAMRILSAQE